MAGFYGRTGVEFRDTVTGNLIKLKKEMKVRIREALLTCGDVIASSAYDKANVSPGVVGHAVDGGHMRDHIEVGIRDHGTSMEMRVGIDQSIVPYAAHQEFGDRGKPFLRPATDESRAECHEILQSVLIEGAEPRTLVRFRGRA